MHLRKLRADCQEKRRVPGAGSALHQEGIGRAFCALFISTLRSLLSIGQILRHEMQMLFSEAASRMVDLCLCKCAPDLRFPRRLLRRGRVSAGAWRNALRAGYHASIVDSISERVASGSSGMAPVCEATHPPQRLPASLSVARLAPRSR